jgi:hypothetical protein
VNIPGSFRCECLTPGATLDSTGRICVGKKGVGGWVDLYTVSVLSDYLCSTYSLLYTVARVGESFVCIDGQNFGSIGPHRYNMKGYFSGLTC